MEFPLQLFDKLMILRRWRERQRWEKGGIEKKNILVDIVRGSCELAFQSICDLSQKPVWFKFNSNFKGMGRPDIIIP